MLLKVLGISFLAYIIMHFLGTIQPKLDPYMLYFKQIAVIIIIICLVYILIKYVSDKIKEYSKNQDSMIFKNI